MFPNNPKWKGRQPTFFAKENTTFEDGCCVMRTYKPEAGSLPEGYTHTAGFLVSKELFLYGYFEARLRPNDSHGFSVSGCRTMKETGGLK